MCPAADAEPGRGLTSTSRTARGALRVLVVEVDLFHSVGGGQTVYRRLINTNPHIDFYYLGVEEKPDVPRPANARMIPMVRPYDGEFLGLARDGDPPPWSYSTFVEASNVAATVAGRDFDVVEIADFRNLGGMLHPALAEHGVRFQRSVLSMHGRLSNSLRMAWNPVEDPFTALDLRERLQYCAADIRYGISRAYLDDWRRLSDLESQYLNPLRILEPPRPVLPEPSGGPPDLCFVGRTEKLKGPDIFLDLVWWLPRELYRTASIIGPECVIGEDRSHAHLRRMMARRSESVSLRPAMTPAELARLFAGRSVVILPSRYDTLNLIALEALFAGCPTVIGTGAGVCRFLRESMPEVPHVALDIRNVYGCLPRIQAMLADYDGYRERLVRALERRRPVPDGPTLADIYASPPTSDRAQRDQVGQWYGHLMRQYEAWKRSKPGRVRRVVRAVARTVLPGGWRQKIRRLYGLARSAPHRLPGIVRGWLRESALRGDAAIAYKAQRAAAMAGPYRTLLRMPEDSPRRVAEKLQGFWALAEGFHVDQARIWKEIARLERVRGNDLMAAAYELRIMRAFGEDRLGHLRATAASLCRRGYAREAEAAQAMFGPVQGRAAACEGLLRRAWERHRTNPPKPYETIDDRRASGAYRASIVVSLYRAADKLEFFLNAINNQTLVQSGAAEVILVDSGSPDRPHKVFSRCAESLRMPVVYARSAERETVQAAWNRGIQLSRGEYLAFLGVDETLLPDALEVLARELDRDPALDWVTGSSLMTAVDEHGTWKDDVMFYGRTDYHPTLPYLDTCYLSWVGALYRRSIHGRCGYYDPSFGAAGDTEFKYRVLPHLKTKSIPRTLGVFLNYPGARVTESPRAEIEDLRAWYLNRTLGGIRYAFDGRDPQAALDLFYRCLGYHKSYWKHTSTDLDYAVQLAEYLGGRAPGLLPNGHAASARRLLAVYRGLDWLAGASHGGGPRALLHARRIALEAQARQTRLGCGPVKPLYRIFNDNRFEQHRNVWRSEIG